MKPRWKYFTGEEVDRIKPRSVLENEKPRECPSCKAMEAFGYHHEIEGTEKSAGYLLCSICRKFVGYTSETLRTKYKYSDPLSHSERSELEAEPGGGAFRDRLVALREEGILPQKFTPIDG